MSAPTTRATAGPRYSRICKIVLLEVGFDNKTSAIVSYYCYYDSNVTVLKFKNPKHIQKGCNIT